MIGINSPSPLPPPFQAIRGYVLHESHVFVLFNFGYYSVAVELEYRRVTGLTYNVPVLFLLILLLPFFLSRRASTHVAVTVLRRPLHELRVHPAYTCEPRTDGSSDKFF